jgi:hypothetical protein
MSYFLNNKNKTLSGFPTVVMKKWPSFFSNKNKITIKVKIESNP